MSTEQSSPSHARLQAALRESELLREMAELLASSLDLERILYVLVKRTTQVCEVERCTVWLLEDTRGVLRPKTYHLASKSLDSKLINAADHLWYRTPLPMDIPVIRTLFSETGMFYVEDLRTIPSLQRIAETFLVGSVLLVALIREGRPVGMLSLDDPGSTRAFSPEQMQLARAIGQQAAIAIDNARLYQQSKAEQKRAEQLIERVRSIYEVAETINASEDVNTVFSVAIEHLTRGLAAKSGMIALLESGELRQVSSTGDEAAASQLPSSISLARLPNCRHAATSGEALYVTSDQTEEDEILWFRNAGYRNIMIVPLMIRAKAPGTAAKLAEAARCVGLAFVNYPQQPPTRGQFAYALDIVEQCALAVEKSQLLAEIRQAATVATERAKTLDAIFHAMSEGITVTDMQGNVLIQNDAASHFLGLPKNTRSHLTTFLRRYPTYTVDGRLIPESDFPLTRALRGERIRAERFVTRRADGEERILEINIAPMYDSDERHIGLVSAFRDVTEHIQAEQRIRHALDTMLHVSEALSGITDMKTILHSVLERTLTTLNCERGAVFLLDEEQYRFEMLFTTGFSKEEEKQWYEDQQLWLSPTPDQYHVFYQQLMAGHAALINADQCPYQPNPLSHIVVLAAPIKHNKRVHGLIVIDRSLAPAVEWSQASTEAAQQERHEFSIWDIAVLEGIAQLAGLAMEQTHWQQEAINAQTREAAMREANELKDEFLAITAHEFRSPLTIILAQSQLVGRNLTRLAKQVQDSESIDKAVKNLAVVEDQARQLTDIVKTFLEVTQLNRGQLTLDLAEVNLADIAQQVARHYSGTSEFHPIQYAIDPDEQPYLVRGDSARLQQVIANLVANAMKYSPLGGAITIRLRRYAGNNHHPLIEVCVEDKGIGIPAEFQPRLFERFYRAPNGLETRTKGIGLGLYIVAQFIQLHGGDIHVESSGVSGEGSRFIIALPALERAHTGDDR